MEKRLPPFLVPRHASPPSWSPATPTAPYLLPTGIKAHLPPSEPLL